MNRSVAERAAAEMIMANAQAHEPSSADHGTGGPAVVNDTGELDAGVDPRLLEILICPVSRGPLTYDREANELVSRAAGLAFPIRNGVPVMLRDEARALEGADS